MMDREYMEDFDTITEDTDDEVLNPDYDRVSGSGAMPSLDDFLGVNHTSDGLGASSDPFGGVIGDPAFGEGRYGASLSGDGSYDSDDDFNDNSGFDVDDEPKNVKFSFKALMNGTYARTWIANYIGLIVVLVILAIAQITIRDRVNNLIHEEMNLRKDVLHLRAESIGIAAQLMSISKVTAVSNLVQQRKLNIRKVSIPPMQVVIDKFERADSLIKDEPAYQPGSLYDDGNEFYSR
ncbi:MAG: hypothetical protein J5595_03050 [Bacteroidales bacterium]|nr:hypothetical protein [Bacteroidales bacterium]